MKKRNIDSNRSYIIIYILFVTIDCFRLRNAKSGM